MYLFALGVQTTLGITAEILAFAIPPVWIARSRGKLFVWDFVQLLATPSVLFLCVLFLNSGEIGLGPVVYPFFGVVLAVAILYIRVFVVDRYAIDFRRNSVACLLAGSVVAAILGSFAPGLPE